MQVDGKAISGKKYTQDVDVLLMLAGTACPTRNWRRHVGRAAPATETEEYLFREST